MPFLKTCQMSSNQFSFQSVLFDEWYILKEVKVKQDLPFFLELLILLISKDKRELSSEKLEDQSGDYFYIVK